MESQSKLQSKNERTKSDIEAPQELQSILGSLLGEDVQFEEVDGTNYLESDSLQFSYTEDDGIFTIRNIEVTNQGSGEGSRIVSALVEYAELHNMEVVATNVKDGKRGFWEHQGFQEGSESGEFYRVE